MSLAKAIRDGYGDALLELGGRNPHVWALTADLTESMKLTAFARHYPERFVQVGVAEQNMMGIAAGLALSGKIPFVSSFAVFSPGRNWDQLRVSVCYQNANVKIAGGHAGLATGPDGATHQALEDIALTQVLPNMTVLVPCDAVEARQATLAAATYEGPVYIRLSREPTPLLTLVSSEYRIGKARVMARGSDVTIVACGPMVALAMDAREILHSVGVDAEVINLHTIKPLDRETIVRSAQKTGCLITVEDHQQIGGMGSRVAQVLCEEYPVPLISMGVDNAFGQSGTARELYTAYGLDARAIAGGVKRVMTHKNRRSFGTIAL